MIAIKKIQRMLTVFIVFWCLIVLAFALTSAGNDIQCNNGAFFLSLFVNLSNCQHIKQYLMLPQYDFLL